MALVDKIFSLFPRIYHLEDSYVDANGKGLLQRYNEMCADEYDSSLGDLIDNLIVNLADPDTAFTRLLQYLESDKGIDESFKSSENFRRAFIKRVAKIYQDKGDKISYEVCFRMLGFKVLKNLTTAQALTDNAHYYVGGDVGDTITTSVGTFDAGDRFSTTTGVTLVSVTGNGYVDRETVVEDFSANNGFDTSEGFDLGNRFDRSCPNCSNYGIELYGDFSLDTGGIFKDIFQVIAFVEPINAHLNYVTYNGITLVEGVITIFINEDGDLIYVNTMDPTLIFTLDSNGDLIATGPNEGKYTLLNGDMIYTP